MLEAYIDEGGTNAGHHLGDLAKVDVSDHTLFTGSLDEQFGELAFFKNGDTVFVRRGIDNDFFFHT